MTTRNRHRSRETAVSLIFRHFFSNGELFDGCICALQFPLFSFMTRVCKRKGRKQTICSNRSLILCQQNPTDQPDICQPVKGSILKPLNHSMNKASKRSPKAIYQMQQLHTPRGFCSSFLETSAPLLAMCVRVSLVSDPLNSFHFLGSFACLNFLLHVVGLMTRWMMGDGIYLESTRFWTLCTNSMICQVPILSIISP